MITLRDRYFYANLTKPTYPIVDVGGVPHYNVGVVEIDGIVEALASGYVIDALSVIDKTTTLQVSIVVTDDIPKAFVYIPTNSVEGMDGYAQLSFRFRQSPSAEWETITSSIRTFPLFDFLVSCVEQPDGIDVWAIDIDSSCEIESLNGNAIDTSITDILFTNEGERPRRINYGSPIPRAIWSNITTAMAENLLDKTIEVLARFELRIFIDRARATMTIDRKRHTVILTIPYSVRENQKKYLYRKKFSTQ